MKTTNNNKKSKFLALLLSAMMLSSMGAAFASCADGADSSSSTSSSSSTEEQSKNDRVDNGTIKNGNFDFTNISETVQIGKSVTGWTRAVNSATTGSAPSSKAASGVINTAESAWAQLTTRNKTDAVLKEMTIANAVDSWSQFTTADKIAFYEIWEAKAENKKLDIDEEFEKYKKGSYESFNVDLKDLPYQSKFAEGVLKDGETIVNPGVAPNQPTKDEAGKDREADTNILMIHNDNSIGTAQKFTSTSIKVPAGSAAKFSVWVKTSELSSVDSDKNEQAAVSKGAYISIGQSVGGKTLDSYEVKNIQTDEWKEYTFYLKGSSFADTSFSIVLGLGQGGGTDHLDYVNGYAFFDNINFEELTLSDYDTKTSGIAGEVILGAEKADKTVDTSKDTTRTEFAMNFYGADDGGWKNADSNFTSATAEKTTSTDGSKKNDDLFNLSNTTDKFQLYANRAAIATEASSNAYLNTIYNHFIKDTEEDNNFIKDDQKILMMLSSKGTAYSWDKAYEFTMAQDVDYMGISFFVKTSDFGEGTGVTITLNDEENSTSFPAISTANMEGVTIDGVENYYDGWQRYYFFVEKSDDLKGSEQKFQLSFNYGPTDITEATANTAFAGGFAAFTKFETLEMSALEYGCAETNSYAKKYTLVPGEEDKAAGNAGFDAAAGTPSNALDNGLANLKNYKGVYSDSYYVSLPANGADIDETKRYANTYENAGLLNRDSFINAENDMVNKNAGEAWMEGLKSVSGSTDATTIWNSVFGQATQPLFIWNDGEASTPYGFIGTSTTISSTFTAVSVRVKTSANANASVYLVDMDDETRQSFLTVSGKLTYWYDDNGNILTGDPNAKDTKIAFRLNAKTGLYEANKKWEHYETYKDKQFANLSAYTESNGVLYAAENSAMHSYHDYKWDREVYYKNAEGKYFLDKAYTEEVFNLTSVTELAHRYEAQAEQALKIENISTNGEWVTVTFYIKKGNAPKNYRLEVWSGTRTGDKNPANSYVAFDTNNPGTANDERFTSLIEEYKETATTKFESVFSYYDTDAHVRYVEALDEEEEGNLYKGRFTPSAHEAGIAYMLHETKEGSLTVKYNVFADYSLSDVTVTPGAPSNDKDNTTDNDTTTDEEGTNIFLLISSIAVSAALLVALGGIATRRIIKIVKKYKASKARVNIVKKDKTK